MSLYQLPSDLPVPVDDGATDHLVGLEVPERRLLGGAVDLSSVRSSRSLRLSGTGTPGGRLPTAGTRFPAPADAPRNRVGFAITRASWTSSAPGGRTVSAALPAQIEFAEREHMPFPVIADPELRLRDALGLPTFEFGGLTLYKRVTLSRGWPGSMSLSGLPAGSERGDVVAWLGR